MRYSSTKLAIIGLGSIGKKHWQFFEEAGIQVCGVSKFEKSTTSVYQEIEQCLSLEKPDIVLIANETNKHFQTLEDLKELGFTGTVLVEKPLFNEFNEITKYPFREILVCYQLRFHPLVQILNSEIKNKKILNALFYVGQYLPDWRPGRDYRTTYSASNSQGGGVLKDLSHELDLALFLTGKFEKVCASGGKVSSLDINSNDSFSILARTANCKQIMVHMNYLNKMKERFLIINTEESTYKLDFITNKLIKNDKAIESQDIKSSPSSLFAQAIVKNKYDSACDYQQGLHIMQVLNACEISSSQEKWITL